MGSDKWIAALKGVDALAGSLIEKAPKGTRIWVTADHGMINVEEKIVIGVDNDLLTDISVVAGEPRARHLYLGEKSSPAAVEEVLHRWREALGDKVLMHSRATAIDSGLFGSDVSLDAAERAGDVIAIARGGVVLLDPERADKEGEMVGHHGGDSAVESSVPLLQKTI